MTHCCEELEADDIRALEPADGFDDDRGCGVCPLCRRIYSANGGYTGDVANAQTGEVADYYDTEPSGGPYICLPCWEDVPREVRDEVATEEARERHQTLESFERADQ